MHFFEPLFKNLAEIDWSKDWKLLVMWALGGLLIYLAIKKEMEPTLLLPMGLGAILVNLPGAHEGALHTLYDAGIANELFPPIP